jgi:hypothetical protein
MRRRGPTRYLLWLVVLLASTGCRSWHHYRPVNILVRDAETKEPIDGAHVRLGYFLLIDPFSPERTAGMTGPDGTVELVAAPYEGRAVMFASADGYFSEGMQSLEDEVIRACDPDRRKPREYVVVEMYAEPAAVLELVVPAGYRGLIRVEPHTVELTSAGRQRLFRAEVPPSGLVHVPGPALLRRAECVDYQLHGADGMLLPCEPEGTAVGFWRLSAAGDEVQFFFVGTQKEYDDHHRLLHRATADGGWEFDRDAAEAWLGRR